MSARALRWLRSNLFYSVPSSLATLVLLYLAWKLVPPFFDCASRDGAIAITNVANRRFYGRICKHGDKADFDATWSCLQKAPIYTKHPGPVSSRD